jgi:hypothetical protein
MKMHRLSILACSCLLLAAGACGGEEGPPASEKLVGIWTDCDDGSYSFSFGQNGEFGFNDPNDEVIGTYAADDTLITANGTDNIDGTRGSYDFTYYISQDEEQLVLGAAFPVGEHDGMVGTWVGTSRLTLPDTGEVMGGERTLELRDDGTGTLTMHDPAGDEVFEGTWGPDAEHGDTAFSYQPQPSVTYNVHFSLIDDAVLGGPLCREPTL